MRSLYAMLLVTLSTFVANSQPVIVFDSLRCRVTIAGVEAASIKHTIAQELQMRFAQRQKILVQFDLYDATGKQIEQNVYMSMSGENYKHQWGMPHSFGHTRQTDQPFEVFRIFAIDDAGTTWQAGYQMPLYPENLGKKREKFVRKRIEKSMRKLTPAG
jgi:hypothetical protein